jgi:hypothetical protein
MQFMEMEVGTGHKTDVYDWLLLQFPLTYLSYNLCVKLTISIWVEDVNTDYTKCNANRFEETSTV